jgi:hypothetical protein
MPITASSAFWDDLAKDLEDPKFRRAFIIESIRIKIIDRLSRLAETLRNIPCHKTKQPDDCGSAKDDP